MEAKSEYVDAAHHGRGSELFLIFLVNLVLTVLTLGVFHFWAKTRVRRYLWSQSSFDGERFEYTGRGLELFLGWLMVMGLLTALAAVYWVILSTNPQAVPILAITAYGVVMVLVGVGIYSAQRYMLSRTQLRAIRFARTGSALGYAGRMLGHGLLLIPTLGLSMPFMRNALTRYALNHTWYGGERFFYEGRGWDLFPEYLLGAFLTPFTLGLSWLWYRAYEQRYMASKLQVQDTRFKLGFGFWPFAWLKISNLLLLVITLGLAYPWVLVRGANFYSRYLQVTGRPDYAAIEQSQEDMPRVGEGLAEAFDLGGI